MKILVIFAMLLFGHFAMASNNIPASKALGHYSCEGYDANRIYHNFAVEIDSKNGKATVTWYEEETEGTMPYSHISLKHVANNFYILAIDGNKYNCLRDW